MLTPGEAEDRRVPPPSREGEEVTSGPSSADHAQGRPEDQMRAERDFPTRLSRDLWRARHVGRGQRGSRGQSQGARWSARESGKG